LDALQEQYQSLTQHSVVNLDHHIPADTIPSSPTTPVKRYSRRSTVSATERKFWQRGKKLGKQKHVWTNSYTFSK